MEIDTLDKIVTKLAGRMLALEVMQSCMLPLLSSGFKDPAKVVEWITDNAAHALAESSSGDSGEFALVKAEAMTHLAQQVAVIRQNTQTLLRQQAERQDGSSQ